MSGRPRCGDVEVLKAAAQSLAEACAEWGDEEWEDELLQAFQWGCTDGHELARYLEEHFGVSPDEDLVEILSGAWWAIQYAHDSAVEEWTKKTGFTPSLSVGDRVSTPKGAGVVQKVLESQASYLVALDGKDRERYIGTVFEAEQVEGIE
jgi:hypothetical protein